jgi:hypothetical protein
LVKERAFDSLPIMPAAAPNKKGATWKRDDLSHPWLRFTAENKSFHHQDEIGNCDE